MTAADDASMSPPLVVRRTIRATAEQIFDAWTTEADLLKWFGPRGVDCIEAQVDLRVGGRYRLVNRFPDGRIVTIAGEFTAIERPHRLGYTWRIDPSAADAPIETVAVSIENRGDASVVTVVHDRIPNENVRRGHSGGWHDCLDALEHLLTVR